VAPISVSKVLASETFPFMVCAEAEKQKTVKKKSGKKKRFNCIDMAI
jgi:hypothetical protein